MRNLLLATTLVLLLFSFVGPSIAQEHGAIGISDEHPGETEIAEAEAHEEETGNVTAWKALNFGLLALALVWLLRKPAQQFFVNRTAGIRQGIQEATKAREEAEARAAEMEKRLANLEAEIQDLRESAKREIAAEDERLRAETEQALSKLRVRSDQEIAAATRAATQQLRAEAARLALESAKSKVRSQLTPEVSDRLMISLVDELGERSERNLH